MCTFKKQADSLVRKLSGRLGAISESERITPNAITYTFESGASVRVWQGAGGKLCHRVVSAAVAK